MRINLTGLLDLSDLTETLENFTGLNGSCQVLEGGSESESKKFNYSKIHIKLYVPSGVQ